jgi:hypothetical protein
MAGNLVLQLESRRSYQTQMADNAARTAVVTLTFDTVGAGEVATGNWRPFNIIFLEEPRVSTGVSVVGGRLTPGYFPQVTAGVTRWQTDPKGFYTGALLFFVVDFPALDLQEALAQVTTIKEAKQAQAAAKAIKTLRLRHHVRFEATGITTY